MAKGLIPAVATSRIGFDAAAMQQPLCHNDR
jgi:hypothetical protein